MNNSSKAALAAGTLGTLGIVAFLNRRTTPKGVSVVKDFELNKYLGDWYEIARMDYLFEKHLEQVTAHYTQTPQGFVKVVNRGFDTHSKSWKESTGKAKFVGDPSVAKLKVSFFGPIYAGYNVMAVDAEYRYALVAGRNQHYLWLLSREKTMPESVKADYLTQATRAGYDTAKLVWTKQ